MAFSEAEERLIEATVPVMLATEQVIAANKAYAEAGQAAAKVAEDEFEDAEVEPEHFHNMLLEAARRAGYAEDSDTFKTIERSFAEYFLMEQMMEELSRAQARDELLEGTGVAFTD